MMEDPRNEHGWLQRFAGEWTAESEATMESGEVVKSTMTESVRSLGGYWIIAEGQGEMPGGGDASMILTIGYDAAKGRYVGTWVGSMMSVLWIYDGEMDATGKVLTLSAEGPTMADDGKTTRYRDVHEFVSEDHRILTSHMQGDDGQWRQFMTAHYYRK